MDDLIQLLPDNIANQIAAGEVIQRPASAVKELMENAIDAGAGLVKLIVNDAGKSLVQVVDNGRGMSITDARMAFERHATSKIRNIDDLFRIRTMGFRGEALASIAAVAQVELKTKRAVDEMGTCIEIENSMVKLQEPVAFPNGSSIAMKNLFFNVPARRNFLKSNAVEMRHIVDEFVRVALSFPAIQFVLISNGQEMFHLESGSLKQRIVQILGANYNARLVSVQEDTDYLNITGFVGKPDTAKRTRGDQYFFVNNRFIRSAYLNHAVMTAYQQMIPGDSFPLYVLFIDIDPSRVDINVHPTKQEIKFEDEKLVYAFVQAAVKHSLAQFSITPSLDFDLDPAIQQLDAVSKPVSEETRASLESSSLFKAFTQKNQAHIIEPSSRSELSHWTPLRPATAGGARGSEAAGNPQNPPPGTSAAGTDDFSGKQHQEADRVPAGNQPDAANRFQSLYSRFGPEPLFRNEDQIRLLQLQNTYIACETNGGFLLVHQQSAHERILYEKFMNAISGNHLATQQGLFPGTITLATADAVLLLELLPDLRALGYIIESFGKDTFIIQGSPAGMESGNEKKLIEKMLEHCKHSGSEKVFPLREKMIRSLAWQQSVKPGTALSETEMRSLVESLFRCAQPNSTPGGKPVFMEYSKDYLEKVFGR
ncbi:MAG: DNA mismatch repair endonuclease MutL [Bacteroidota bacterium]|nr:DNA mismatch repair endonuclease MutL [Bacteroidota bacterium]